MSKYSKPPPAKDSPAGTAGKPQKFRVTVILLAIATVAALGYWSWKSKRGDMQPPGPVPIESVATNPPTATTAASPDFQKLKGRWLRPDGGYVVDIRNVSDSGKLDAAYFNPKPIHVSRAEASREGATIKVFIELRDVNYPGSTYALAYDAEADQLKGIYFQAVQQQNFDVFFVRAR